MKNIIYYSLLFVFAILLGVFLRSHLNTMNTSEMVGISLLIGLYVIALSFIGEGKTTDERESSHRYISNRTALIAGTVVLSIGILYQLFSHKLDLWLLVSLIAINVVKIIAFLYAHYKN